jgi:TonB family protein
MSMNSRRLSLLLGAAAVVAGPAQAEAQSPPVPMPPPIMRPAAPPPPPPPMRAPAPPPPRPLAPQLRPVAAPDWSDPDIYPAAALRLGQEGAVRFELRVGRNGRPIGCTVVESSGHAELDDGTCRLALTMRFAPVAAETTLRTRIVWLLAPDPMPFVPHRMVATLDLEGGNVANCALAGSGPLFETWARVACRTFELEAAYYLGVRRWTARRARIVVDLLPDGAAVPPPQVGTPIALRRTAFTVDANGDPGNCATIVDRGFGRPRIDHADACGFFLARGFEFVEAAEGAPPRSGMVEVRVLIEPRR